MSVEITANKGSYIEFTLQGCSTPCANGLRRIIIARLPVAAMNASSDEDSTIQISANTGALSNEIVKHRLSCIPVHGLQQPTDLSNYTLRLDVTADEDTPRLVTTADIQVMWGDAANLQPAPASVAKSLFPANPITGDHIVITKLNPAIPAVSAGERLAFDAKLYWTEGSVKGTASAACTCSYKPTPDPARQEEAWQSASGGEDNPQAKQDWLLGPGTRITIPNSYDFCLEGIGVYSPVTMLNMACDILSEDLANALASFTEDGAITPLVTTLQDAHNVKITGDVYTVGYLLQDALYAKHCVGPSKNYVGFRKDHPHDSYGTLRVAIEGSSSPAAVLATLTAAVEELQSTIATIKGSLPSESVLSTA